MDSVRWVAIGLRAVLLGLFLWMVKGLFAPVVLGSLLALLLAPLVRRLSRRPGLLARAAPLLVTLAALVLVILPVTVIVIRAVQSSNDFIERDWTTTFRSIERFLEQLGPLRGVIDRFGMGVRQMLDQAIRQAAGALATAAANAAKSLPQLLIDAFLFSMALYYLLRDGHRLTGWLRSISPFGPVDTDELFQSIRDTVTGSLLGMIATALVQGTLTTIALFALEVPGALIWGLLATGLAFLPMVGTSPITVGAVLYLLAAGRPVAAAIMAGAAVIVGVSDNIVRPLVQSAQSHMHPLLVLIGIFGGLQIFGASGVFVGPVVVAMVVWTVDTYAKIRLRQQQRQQGPGSQPPPSQGAPPS